MRDASGVYPSATEDKHMSEDTTTTDADSSADTDETETPDLGDAGQKAIKAERDARKAAERTAAELAAQLKSIEDANLSELERAKKAAEASATELAQLRVENTRTRVALEKGVPADLIEFLTGSTEEEIAAKADVLLSRLGSSGTPKPDPSQGAKGSTQKKSTGAQFADFFNENLTT
jgi:colicin import membrane protein